MNPLSLYELNTRIRTTLSQELADDYWIQAELSDVRIHATGHCYLEFIQKDAHSNILIAKARGTIWSQVFRLLRPYFERETNQPFTAGIKVLVKVHVEFHQLYGYSLTVLDIDPTYTVGDMIRRRREIIRQLQEEGVFTLNKELHLSQVPRHIAVISSPHAAGYGDFCNQLSSNPYGFTFSIKLFEAIMQGDRVEKSILDALDRIHTSSETWDAVIIIRGGGAVSDLSGFDTYLLAASCAQYPIPIITGIGHERDDTLIDMVAHTRVKTPTAAAEFLINRVHEAALRLNEITDNINVYANQYLELKHQRINDTAKLLPNLVTIRRLHEEHRLQQLWQRLTSAEKTLITTKHHHLQLIQQKITGYDPQILLARGFSLTLKEGHVVTDSSQLSFGDVVTIRFAQSETTAEIKNSSPILSKNKNL